MTRATHIPSATRTSTVRGRAARIVERLGPWRTAFEGRARPALEPAADDAARAGARVEPLQARSPETEGRRRETSMHVMVLSPDRRFRQVVSLLLGRRGCAVSLGEGGGTLAERVDRDRTEVVLIDAGRSLAAAARMAAAVEALGRPVGIVVVGDEAQGGLLELQPIPKWGSFELLFEAVKRSHDERGRRRALFECARTR